LQFLKYIKVKRIETRSKDFWYDMSLRQLRVGEVSFFSVKDFLTGEWLFKLCNDVEIGKVTVTAVKCPAGVRFSQLEGKSMVFQGSQVEDMLYDVISLTEFDENNRLKRNVVSSFEEVPDFIKENFVIRSYEEATGKKVPGKYLVTLHKKNDENMLVTLFLLERAWRLSDILPAEKLNELKQLRQKKKIPKKEMDTGEVWSCPICNEKHHLLHIEKEKSIKHVLRKSR
jgi:hypothetical protein